MYMISASVGPLEPDPIFLQGAYRLEISACSERVWSTDYAFLVQTIPRFWGLLMLQRGVNEPCVTFA